MGYYTAHKLEIELVDENLIYDVIFDNVVRRLDELDVIDSALDDNLETYDSVKWYSHEDDMRKVSSEFKGVIFKLEGEGEEAGDMWVEYYLDGKMQRCEAKITFDEFDKNKLE